MNANTRNVAVGLTVIVALGIVAGMIVLFAGVPGAFEREYRVRIHMSDTGGTQRADPVFLSGIRIGKISTVNFVNPNDPSAGVELLADIAAGVRIPASARAQVVRPVVGVASVNLVIEVGEGKPAGTLPTDGSAVIEGAAQQAGMAGQLEPVMNAITQLANSLQTLVEPSGTTTQPTAGLGGTVARLNRTLDAMYAMLGAPDTAENFQKTLANLAEASAKASEMMDALRDFAKQVSQTAQTTGENIDEMTARLIATADDISELMKTMNQTVQQIQAGEGTAGKMISDPQLYNNLVAATAQLDRLLVEFEMILRTWREKGLQVKM